MDASKLSTILQSWRFANNMTMKYVLFVFILINLEAFAYRKCKDCVNISKCPSASNYMQLNNNDNVRKFREAFCGIDEGGSKICCSNFPVLQQDEVENHPNINLLPENCGYIDGNRIIGGSVAYLYEFPWMALISYHTDDGFAFQCAGSVINSRYILTAAHCIMNRDIAGVRIGEFDVRYEFDCQKSHNGGAICESHVQDIRVDEAIYHERYQGYPRYAYDIGLLRLKKDIDFSYKNARPICLPTTKKLRSVSLENKMATVAGWGLTENKKESSVLLKVVIPILPESECINFYSRILEPSDSNAGTSQFCAGAHYKDTCDGDSGAPLIIEDTVKFIQYGIVSQGRKECGSQTPAVYTSVTAYMTWILDKLKP